MQGRCIGIFNLCALVLILTGCGINSGSAQSAGAVTDNQSALLRADADQLRAHVTYLASDELNGREAGTPGYDAAARYVADQFESLGLAPVEGSGTYMQPVPLRRAYRVAESASLVLIGNNGEQIPLEAEVDFSISASPRNGNVDIEAPLVFVGYGMVISEEGRDDYAGLDVKGKVVAYFASTPSHLQSEERAYYGSQRAVEASKRGAIGVLSLSTPLSEKVSPFARRITSGSLDRPRMSWVRPSGETYSRAPNIQGGASLSPVGVEKLFAHIADPTADWQTLWRAASEEKAEVPSFETGLRVGIRAQSMLDDIQSPNVAGFMAGSDPQLRDEVLVLTAHLDHLGVSNIDAADRINNGALDNAAGVATLLEVARLLKKQQSRRSILFLAVTAEEKGLLGAQYFAKNPSIEKSRLVGNINLDMPVLTYDFTDIIVFGGNRSTLKAAIEKAGSAMNIQVSPDPFPEQGIFTRSDHYRFVQEGIPSVMLATGFANGGEAAFTEHLKEHYHQPSDDLSRPINWRAAAKFTELNARIVQVVADSDQRPLWHEGDFFAEKFAGPTTGD